MTPIQILKTEYKLPIDVATEHGHQTSLLLVMQQVCAWEMTNPEYLALIGKLIGATDPITGWSGKHMPKYVAGYLIQFLVKNYIAGTSEHIENTYLKAINKAMDYIANNAWVFATGEDENAPPKLDAAGNPQAAKGDKKLKAKELWTANQGKITTRKGWIDLLVSQCGMTPAGASTYYHNLKTGVY